MGPPVDTRRALASAFVLVAGCGGASESPTREVDPDPPGVGVVDPIRRSPARVERDARGCVYIPASTCPKDAECEVPPAYRADCPPELRRAGDAEPDDRRPSGKEGWIRRRESFRVEDGYCRYLPDALCPPPGEAGRCASAGASRHLICHGAQPGATEWEIHPFEVTRATGTCVHYEEFFCSHGVPCEAPPERSFECGKAPAWEPDDGTFSAWVSPALDGTCRLAIEPHCPEGIECNPPAPFVVDCPPQARTERTPQPLDARPAGREAWLRVRPRLWISGESCGYQADFLCPEPGTKAACDTPSPLQRVPCNVRDTEGSPEPPAGRTGWIWVPTFTADHGVAGCVRYPDQWCHPLRGCDFLEWEEVACE